MDQTVNRLRNMRAFGYHRLFVNKSYKLSYFQSCQIWDFIKPETKEKWTELDQSNFLLTLIDDGNLDQLHGANSTLFTEDFSNINRCVAFVYDIESKGFLFIGFSSLGTIDQLTNEKLFKLHSLEEIRRIWTYEFSTTLTGEKYDG